MLIRQHTWKNILGVLFIVRFSSVVHGSRSNLAHRHPCYELNRRLEPFIQWTEKLASTQYRATADACGQRGSGPACCTTEIFDSYARSLGHELKTISDAELGQLTELMSRTEKQIVMRWREYLGEYRRLTTSSLQTIFGSRLYHAHVEQDLSTLFNILVSDQANLDDVTRASNRLFDQLILSSYSQFSAKDPYAPLDDQLKTCLIITASHIDALPTRRELLFTLTSAASLIHIARTLFVYMDADIERLKRSAFPDPDRCFQRYAQESLCPICASADADGNEPLCEDSCRFVMKTCLEQTNNPYVTFALVAQGYSNVIKQIQELIVELKLVERLSKLHTDLYDMVINAANKPQTYAQLKLACPDANRKPFAPITAISPTTNERHELVALWNTSIHAELDVLQMTIDSLNESLTQQVSQGVCMEPRYASKSDRCTPIDPHMFDTSSQWPLPAASAVEELRRNTNVQSMRDQLYDLEKKMIPVQGMAKSLQPVRKAPLIRDLPYFEEYLEAESTDGDEAEASTDVTGVSTTTRPLSEQLDEAFDGKPIHRTDQSYINHSNSITPASLASYLSVAALLITLRISLTNQ